MHYWSLTHLVLHELRELRWIISTIYDVLHQKFLLHRTKLFICILGLVEGASWLHNSVHVSIVLFVYIGRLGLCCFDHVLFVLKNWA